MYILDNEGELIVNLTDIETEEQLNGLLDKECPSAMEVLNDTPFFANPIPEGDSWLTETLKLVADPNVDQIEKDLCYKECTYREWMDGCLQWYEKEHVKPMLEQMKRDASS